jgi:hypothetical protein
MTGGGLGGQNGAPGGGLGGGVGAPGVMPACPLHSNNKHAYALTTDSPLIDCILLYSVNQPIQPLATTNHENILGFQDRASK